MIKELEFWITVRVKLSICMFNPQNPPIWGNYEIGPNKPFKTFSYFFFKLPNKGLTLYKFSLLLPSKTQWWHSVITSLVGIFHIFLRVIHCDSWSWKPQKTKIWRSQNSATDVYNSAIEFTVDFHTLASTFFGHRTNAIRPPKCFMGHAFSPVQPLILRVRPPNFTGLYIERCIFRIRVHEFWDLRHILEQKLCRFGGQSS